ncbi:hypothetical protein, partial [Neisseria meningitidis]|uniref:hypothetical protein n=1 Tax=Neisseria meningitidis TaxID=487 RepID=UPI001C94CC0D
AKSKETVLPDKFPYRWGWIPACAGMTAERFLFFPINAAISNPVIPTKVGIQNPGLSDNL